MGPPSPRWLAASSKPLEVMDAYEFLRPVSSRALEIGLVCSFDREWQARHKRNDIKSLECLLVHSFFILLRHTHSKYLDQSAVHINTQYPFQPQNQSYSTHHALFQDLCHHGSPRYRHDCQPDQTREAK